MKGVRTVDSCDVFEGLFRKECPKPIFPVCLLSRFCSTYLSMKIVKRRTNTMNYAVCQGTTIIPRHVATRRKSWAIGRALSTNEQQPEMVLACVILTYAKTMAETPSRRAEFGVQVIPVCLSVPALTKLGFLTNTEEMFSRMKQDPFLLHTAMSEVAGLNYASQIVGGGEVAEGPQSNDIGFAACEIYEVKSLCVFEAQ